MSQQVRAKFLSFIKTKTRGKQGELTSTSMGFLVGIGGLNEWSAIGIAAWLTFFSRDIWLKHKQRFYWQDVIVLAAASLCILHWKYIDPILAASNDGLTPNEAIKMILWSMFGMSLIRSRKSIFFGAMNGIASGIGLFALATTIGALAFQPFQGSNGQIFNVFTGEATAGSTLIAYSCVASTLLFLITKNKLAWIGAITCVVLGIQAVNRYSLFVGLATIVFLILRKYSRQIVPSSTGGRIKITFVIVISILLTGCLIAYVINSDHQALSIASITRLKDLTDGSDPRIALYSNGYVELFKAIGSNSPEMLADVQKFSQDSWWHSLPLDSTRSSGWWGLLLSLIWILGITQGVLKASDQKGNYIFVGIFTLLTLLMSIPVGMGSYELLGSLTLTQAIISSDKS